MNSTLIVSLVVLVGLWTMVGSVVLDGVSYRTKVSLRLFLAIGPLLTIVVGGCALGEALAKWVNNKKS